MNVIKGEAIVSCYVDAASLLVMVVLLLLSERLRRRGSRPLRIFHALALCVTAKCVLSFAYNAMYMQTAPWCHVVALTARTLRECLILVIIGLWLVYVDQKLYGDRKRHSTALGLAFLPFAVLLVLLIVNVFTGIIFTYSADNKLVARPLLHYIYLLEFVYFCSSAVMVQRYDRKAMKVRFIHISPMILSVVLASGTQYFAPYDIGILGYVTGIIMLYFSMIGEYRFVDEESELYNQGYLTYLFDLALAGKCDAQSALILEADGYLPGIFGILRDTLHQDGDVIRVAQKRFLVFSRENSRSTIQYLASMVEEAVERYNAEHPDAQVHLKAHLRMREGGEDAFTFLRTVMDEKEGGAEVRGIVSMISELDQLDKELKLAADIQNSVLPMVFPPFPDRHEFDIYASMDPAREVGGDFYDFFFVDPDHLAMVIADVSGKGIPAALFMMISRTLIKNQMMAGLSPAQALANVNQQLCERNASKMFVTTWAAVLELSTGKGLACNAGHENPAVRQGGERFKLLVYKHNMFLGVSKKARYEDRPFEMRPGDSLLVYTDGVTEANDSADEMFGNARLEAALNLDADATPEALIGNVRQAVSDFVRGAPQYDDITMLSMKYYGSEK